MSLDRSSSNVANAGLGEVDVALAFCDEGDSARVAARRGWEERGMC